MSRILITDDDPDIVQLMRAIFEASGHEVIAPANEVEALAVSAGIAPDLIVLDINMPLLSGWEVLKRLRASGATRRTPVLMLTASAEAHHRSWALRGGADDFLTKPFDSEELVARAERLIRGTAIGGTVLQGQLEARSVAELLEGLQEQASSGWLILRSQGQMANISLLKGRPCTAQLGPLVGYEAIWEALEMRSGQFDFQPTAEVELADRKPLERSLGSLLREAAWVADERAHRLERLPTAQQDLFWARGPREIPEAMRGLPLRRVEETLRERPGRNLAELCALVPAALPRTQLALLWLMEQGCVLTRQMGLAASFPATEGMARLLDTWLSHRAEQEVTLCLLPVPGELAGLLQLLRPWHSVSTVQAEVAAERGEGLRLEIPLKAWTLRFFIRSLNLAAVGEIFAEASRADGVVLWLGSSMGPPEVPPRLLHAAALHATLLVVAGKDGAVQQMALPAGQASRWKHGREPADLEGLLALLFAERPYRAEGARPLALPALRGAS